MEPPPLAAAARALRAFNRFYTHRIGALQPRLLDSAFTLPESRLLWELAHEPGLTAADLSRRLALDPGYLSRLLRGLQQRGLLAAEADGSDARRRRLRLSADGERAFAPLDARSQQQAEGWLQGLPARQRQALRSALQTVQRSLEPEAAAPQARPAPPRLRPHRPGDLGWVVSRHGALYAQEFGWDASFEALVARIAADFIERFDAAREACWIAEAADGTRLGSVLLVQARDEASGAPEPGCAQLRLLLVEPAARGLGVGKRLVAECERFARAAGYARMRLWTQSMLLPARAIYAAAGWQLVESEPHRSFGAELVGERWERELSPP